LSAAFVLSFTSSEDDLNERIDEGLCSANEQRLGDEDEDLEVLDEDIDEDNLLS
jgi:hypothetical protein